MDPFTPSGSVSPSAAKEAAPGSASTTPVVGIIGDGQLGMMLCQAASELSLTTVLLTADAANPAARSASNTVVGKMNDPDVIQQLVQACDVITYEREDVPAEAIAVLRAAESAGKVQCFPSLSVIELIQDKGLQKSWLRDQHIPTLPFILSSGDKSDAHRAAEQLGFPLVQKALRGGFDGRGVQLLRGAADLEHAWPGDTLYEQFAGDFEEIAVLMVRGQDGGTGYFGPVAMSFETEYSVLDTVHSPAMIDEESIATAVTLAERTITAMKGVGTFGVEMFLLQSGEVLINEISPRVHNAGHYTIEACASSQFEQHLRAVTGMPLADTSQKSPAAMRNVLCTPPLEEEGITREAGVSAHDSVREHWYGKSPARAMRKLGHITALGATVAEATALVDQRWQQLQDNAKASN